MDEISTGLDSSTTFQIVKCMQQIVRLQEATILMSLLQPAPETFELFDDLILLSDDHVIFHGPRDLALPFFASCGFVCPDGKPAADFLLEISPGDLYISTPQQPRSWCIPPDNLAPEGSRTIRVLAEGSRRSRPSPLLISPSGSSRLEISPVLSGALAGKLHAAREGSSPRGRLRVSFALPTDLSRSHRFIPPAELAHLFRLSPAGQNLRPLRPLRPHPVPPRCSRQILPHRCLLCPPPRLLRQGVCTHLPELLLKDEYEDEDRGRRRDLHRRSTVWYPRQHVQWIRRALGDDDEAACVLQAEGSAVLPGLGFHAPQFSSQNTNLCVESSAWVLMTYFSIGFAPEPTRFFKQLLLFFSMQQMAAGLFRLIASVCRSMTISNTGGSLMLLTMFILGGFILPKNLIPTWWVWGHWISPLSYGFNAIVVNEFWAPRWMNKFVKNGKSLGLVVMENADVYTGEKWYWIGIAALIGFAILFNMLFTLAINYLNRTFRTGVLTALMGVSGAGKMILMDVLAGRKTGGYIEGDIRVTVWESLVYSAFLRLPEGVNRAEKMKFVDEVMQLVELDNLKDAIVGLPGITGLSTEQWKRLTIALELIANPSIIFMDEPTSGLDARATTIVMRTVRNTVDTGRTVVCTIHQPSVDIFEAFDESVPQVPKITDKVNPATWMLEVSSISVEVRLGVDFATIYRSSDLYTKNKELINDLSKPASGTSDLHFPTRYSQSSFGQFKTCFWKKWWTYWRSPDYNLVRLCFTLFTALLLGSIFWKIGHKRESANDLRIVIGSMFVVVLFVSINNCSTVKPIFAIERSVYYRERAAGMYFALPYALAQVFVEIPYVHFQTLYYSIIVYSMMSFEWTTTKFLWFYFISFFSFLYFTYYGMMSVSLTLNQQVAAIFAATFYSLFNLFSGFFIPRSKIPKWWAWYYWMCPLAWTVYVLIITQYGDLDDIIHVPGQADQPIKLYIMDYFGYRLDFMSVVAIVLVGFCILFAFTFAFCIRRLNFRQR
ncbi:Pleiotropic drug resistance protein 12 [Platanthera guangdongensis]|uniref:Pleiotropic drug resistance protein 12 n=1 Tax=Platanthera guangdongensis TaxID=2320717 RepID=A0ABR2LLK4_9ASPA